jgi:hypothetical protein
MGSRASQAPTWGTEAILVNVKGSGMDPLPATRLNVILPDGSMASKKETESLVVWPSARLRVVFGQTVNWFGLERGPWHAKAVGLVLKLAALVSPRWIVQDIINRVDIPVLKAAAYSTADAKKIAGRALFDYRKDRAWACLRSGGPRDVCWERSVLVGQHAVQVHLPRSEQNLRLLERTLDRLVSSVPFAWAGVGHGWDGFASAMALSRNEMKPKNRFGGVNLQTLRQLGPKDGTDTLLWIGRAWGSEKGMADEAHERLIAPLVGGAGRSVTRAKGLARVELAGSPSAGARGAKSSPTLSADLASIIKRNLELARRAVLRKRR